MFTGKTHSDVAAGCLSQSLDIDQSSEGPFCEFTITGTIHSESNVHSILYDGCKTPPSQAFDSVLDTLLANRNKIWNNFRKKCSNDMKFDL